MGAFLKMKLYVQLLIVLAVCAGLLGGAWYWFMAPIGVDIEAKSKKLTEVQAKVDKSLKEKARLEQFKKETETLRVKLEDLKKILPQDKETQQLLKQVQASATESGLRIQQGVSKPVIDHEVYTEWPLEMEVVGTYHNLAQFFERVRRLPRIVNIGKLRLEARPSTNPEAAYTASLGATYEATTFVYREDATENASPATPVKAAK